MSDKKRESVNPESGASDAEVAEESTETLDDEEFEEFASPTSRKRSWKKWASLAVGIALVAATFAVVSGGPKDANGAEVEATKEEAAEEDAPIPVEVTDADLGSVASYVSASANLVAENDVEVLGEVEGRVTSLLVDEGHLVGKGQVLARLDPSDEQIALRKAELRHANARSAFERGEDLFAKELISREESDKLTVDFRIAAQEMAEAQWALSQTVIRAPFSGKVTSRDIQLGQHVSPGNKLFQITDFDPLVARIYLSEGDVVALAAGTPARIDLNASENVSIEGRIRQISPVVDIATGTVKVTVEAVAPPKELRPGSFVSVHIEREKHESAVRVPREAVLRELQSTHVFVTDGKNAAKRSIELGIEEGDFVEVVAGLAAGDRVITAGQGGLRDGTRVRILGEEPAESEADSEDQSSSPAAG